MKTQGIIVLLTVATLACGCLACPVLGLTGVRGSGHVVEEEREVSGFSGVELATPGNLHIEIGGEEELRIEAEDNLMQYFEVEGNGRMLKIKSRPGVSLRPTKPVHFYLTATELDTIVLSGSGDVTAPDLEGERISVTISGSGDVRTGDLDADKVEVRISGSGDMDISGSESREQEVTISGSGDAEIGDLNADRLKVRISGSGTLDIQGGEVEGQNVTLNGSGDYEARHLESDEADVRINGSGSMTIQVDERLEARIIGSGDVRYAGSPTVELSVTGSGDVVRIGN